MIVIKLLKMNTIYSIFALYIMMIFEYSHCIYLGLYYLNYHKKYLIHICIYCKYLPNVNLNIVHFAVPICK